MLNNLVIIGRIVNSPEVLVSNQENAKSSKMMRLTVAVMRPFKNRQGVYEEDYIMVKVWSNLVSDILTALKLDAMVAIRGRIQSFKYKDNDNNYLEVIADRITKVGHYLIE